MVSATLSAELMNALLQYLGTRPFSEVAQLMSVIQNELQAQGQSIVFNNPRQAANDAATDKAE